MILENENKENVYSMRKIPFNYFEGRLISLNTILRNNLADFLKHWHPSVFNTLEFQGHNDTSTYTRILFMWGK